jgi:hypothetical protein
MPIGALLGAAGGLLGSAFSAFGNYRSSRMAQEANIDAMKNRHTWEVADLRRAGLNPILSATHGGSQGMPGVATHFPDAGQTLASAGQAFAAANKMEAEVEKITQEVENLKVVKELNTEQIREVVQRSWLYVQQASNQYEQAFGRNIQNQTELEKKKFLLDNKFLLKAEAVSKSLGIKLSDVLNIFNIIGLKQLGTKIFGGKYKGQFDPSTGEISPGTMKRYPPKVR